MRESLTDEPKVLGTIPWLFFLFGPIQSGSAQFCLSENEQVKTGEGYWKGVGPACVTAVSVTRQLLEQWFSRLRRHRGMEMKPFVHKLHLEKSNNLLIQAGQEGHVSSPCLFIPRVG